jgi:thiaminase
MEKRYLYTIKWTQPYATEYMRPYLRELREAVDQAIEDQLERKEWRQAEEIIERIMKL